MADFIRRNKRSVAWVIGIWMLVVVVLLAVGPVVKIK